MDMHIHGTAQASTGWELWFFFKLLFLGSGGNRIGVILGGKTGRHLTGQYGRELDTLFLPMYE
jgi:hypothetical protein